MRKQTVQASAPVSLVDWLGEQFPALTKGRLKEALKKRDIRVNGTRISSDEQLMPGDEVVVYIDDRQLDGAALDIVYESDEIIVAVKPAGINATAESGADMEGLLRRWLAGQGKPSSVFACHRLDNQTGGLLIFARSAEAETAVRAAMEAGRVVKMYSCIVRGVPQPSHAVLTAYLRKNAEKAIVTVLDRPAPGAKTAVTEYTLLGTDGQRSLLSVALHTGRTHQIRAHLAHIGHPILGDDKYGDRQFNRLYHARRQLLWAGRLEFSFQPDEFPPIAGLAGVVLERPAPFLGEIV